MGNTLTWDVADRLAQSEEPDNAVFRKPSLTVESPRATRAQARTSQKSQGSSQEASKPSFRPPKQTVTRKARTPPVNGVSSVSSKQAGESEQGFKKPHMFANFGDVTKDSNDIVDEHSDPVEQAKEQFARSDEIRSAADLAKEKLDMLTKPYRHPPSSKTGSSMPSTSVDDASSDSALTTPPDSPNLSPTQKNIEYVRNVVFEPKKKPKDRCPVCNENIDQELLEEYPAVDRLMIREQSQFCKAHKRRTAETTWEKQGFPKIDWHGLDGRLNKFHDAINDILQGRKFSFYRNGFEDIIKTRKDRSLQKNLMKDVEIEELTPGYYGSRGARIMRVDTFPKEVSFCTKEQQGREYNVPFCFKTTATGCLRQANSLGRCFGLCTSCSGSGVGRATCDG